MLDFPSSPAINERFPSPPIPGVPTWYWDGQKWRPIGGGGGGAAVYVSATMPVDAPMNSLWWNSATGRLFLRFDDGDSIQWVGITDGGGALGK